MEFYLEEKVNVTKDCAYKGQNVIIKEIHISFNPILYTCQAKNGKLIALYETEIQSMYQHDIKMLEVPH